MPLARVDSLERRAFDIIGEEEIYCFSFGYVKSEQMALYKVSSPFIVGERVVDLAQRGR